MYIQNRHIHFKKFRYCKDRRLSYPRLRHLPDLSSALKSYMYVKHKLGYADRKTDYYTYYQSLLPHVNKSMSNVLWTGLFSATNGALYRTRTLHAFYRILKVPFVELLPPSAKCSPQSPLEGH
eukprot:141516-Pelagomonas_calceolata.AAC.1